MPILKIYPKCLDFLNSKIRLSPPPLQLGGPKTFGGPFNRKTPHRLLRILIFINSGLKEFKFKSSIKIHRFNCNHLDDP